MRVTLKRDWLRKADNGDIETAAKGAVLEVDERVGRWLCKTGAAVDGAAEPAPVDPGAGEDPVDPPSDPEGGDDLAAPAKNASIEKWRAWAEELGFDTEGKTRDELIALANQDAE